jgi:hypothetical protein
MQCAASLCRRPLEDCWYAAEAFARRRADFPSHAPPEVATLAGLATSGRSSSGVCRVPIGSGHNGAWSPCTRRKPHAGPMPSPPPSPNPCRECSGVANAQPTTAAQSLFCLRCARHCPLWNACQIANTNDMSGMPRKRRSAVARHRAALGQTLHFALAEKQRRACVSVRLAGSPTTTSGAQYLGLGRLV